MKSLFNGVRAAASSLADAVEAHSPTVRAKLSDLGREVQTRAAVGHQVFEEKAKEVKVMAQKVLADERTQGMISSVSNGLDTVKNKFTTAASAIKADNPEPAPKEPIEAGQAKLARAIEELSGRDKVGVSGEVLATAGGAAAGVAVAGTLASAAGATTLLGSTGLASLLGGVFVATTPVGWVIGSAVLAGAAGYGLTRMVRSGTNQDITRKEIIERLRRRLDVLRDDSKEKSLVIELGQLVAVSFASNLITEEQGRRMVDLVEKGALKPELAIARLKAMALAAGAIEKLAAEHAPSSPTAAS